MFNVTRRVSFAIALALIVGWGIFFLLFLTSENTLFAAQIELDAPVTVTSRKVLLNVQVDKKIYRGGDVVLLAVRNDSRTQIWFPKADACPAAWWNVERLGDDGIVWKAFASSKPTCTISGIEEFATHSLKTDAWQALVPGNQIGGGVLDNPPTGTYRIVTPFLKGKNSTSQDWTEEKLIQAASSPFTIQ